MPFKTGFGSSGIAIDGDLDWLDEFGLGEGCTAEWENEEKTIPADVGVRGLVEGLVVGLEVSIVMLLRVFDAKVLLRLTFPINGRCSTPASGILSVRYLQ